MRTDRALLLVAAVATGGCSSVCKGPGCASAYDAEKLSTLLWSPDKARTLAVDDADHVLRGTTIEGTDWVVRPGPPGTLWIGMPDANQVVRVPVLGDLVPDLVITGSGRFGATLEVMDLDGDGARELLVGAPDYDLAVGGVFVFTGTGPSRTGTLDAELDADLAIVGTSSSDHFGARMFPCADLTGDQRPEIAIAAPWLASPPGSGFAVPDLAGGVYLIRSESLAGRSGQADPLDLGTLWFGENTGHGAGRAVSCRSDFTGDRRADVAIGAPYAENGRVYLIPTDGNAAELGQQSLPDSGSLGLAASQVLDSPWEEGFFGASLASLELDREAPLDLVVGAPGADGGKGQVAVYRGLDLFDGDGVPWREIRNRSGRNEPDHFGAVLEARDVDGDLVDDLLVGVPDWYGGNNLYDTGQLFLWTGASAAEWPPNFTVDSATWTIEGTSPFQRVGQRMAVIDVDQDGVRDVLLATRSTAPKN